MRTFSTQAQVMMKEQLVRMFHLVFYYMLFQMKNKNWLWYKYLQISVSFFITTGYEDITKIGLTFSEEIIDKIFDYDDYILMTEHLPMYQYVLQDIEERLKIISTDCDWHEPCYREIDNVFHLHFPWKLD